MKNLIGVFWGAFDPPTKAHLKVISEAIDKLLLEKLIIIVNNHSYKKYTYPLELRIQMLENELDPKLLTDIEILYQDDSHKIDYLFLSKKYKKPLCAIAGSDAYLSWKNHSTKRERELYDTIAVIPRGTTPFELEDSNAILLTLDKEFRHISSTQVKKQD
jgi:cytidyltransferase-like protein